MLYFHLDPGGCFVAAAFYMPDPDVLDAFKAGGPGWQGRVNAALRRAAGLS